MTFVHGSYVQRNFEIDRSQIELSSVDESSTIRVIPAGGEPFHVAVLVIKRDDVVMEYIVGRTEDGYEAGLLLQNGTTIDFHLMNKPDDTWGSKTFVCLTRLDLVQLLRGE